MRRNILTITREIVALLQREEELSIRQIFLRVRTNRDIVLKSLEFLKDMGLAEERRGHQTNRGDRLFRLTEYRDGATQDR